MNNEILGIIIPLLMSGASPLDILKAVGRQRGASELDGLQGMLRSQRDSARLAYPLTPDQNTISNAVEPLVEKLGVDPYSSFGQGLSAFVSQIYHLAPDTIGGILGVPNGGQFFSTVVNGASGIGAASGYGATDIFNPYSTLSAHIRARNMARVMYDMGVKESGGYDMSYAHGLNMGEMGKVAQRVLSSDIAYMDDDGRRLNLSEERDAEKFNSNLKKLGSRFNEAASMLAKVTGSVEEALNVMDRIAGGNFLGGSEEQARAVAERAKSMAASIRITSAIAGINPQEVYSNMSNLQSMMATGTGMSDYIARESGYGALMGEMAYNATAAYTAWSAMNPRATPQQRSQALLAVNGRAHRYASQNGAALAAAVADNRQMFSQEELDDYLRSVREGNPDKMVGLIRERLGESTFSAYLADPSMQVAARYRVSRGDQRSRDFLRDADVAGQEAGMRQAEMFGNRMLVNRAVSDLDSGITRMTGTSVGLYAESDKAVADRLRRLATDPRFGGLSDKRAQAMNAGQLRTYLETRPGVDSGWLNRVVNSEMIAAAEKRIDNITMGKEDEAAAGARLIARLKKSGGFNADEISRFESRIGSGDLGGVVDELSRSGAVAWEDMEDLRKDVMGGRMTRAQADVEKRKLSRLKESQREDFSVRERLDEMKRDADRRGVASSGELQGMIASEGFGQMADKMAITAFSDRVKKMGIEGLNTDEQMTDAYGNAAANMLRDILGKEGFGNLNGEDYDKFLKSAGERIMSGVMGGNSIQQAFASVMQNLSDDQRSQIGQEGLQRIKGLVADAMNKGSDLSAGKLNRQSLMNHLIGYDQSAIAGHQQELRDLAGSLGSEEKQDYAAMQAFGSKMVEMEKEGKVSLGGKGTEGLMNEAAYRMVKGVFGDRLGNLKGAKLDEFTREVASLGNSIMSKMPGHSIGSAYSMAMDRLRGRYASGLGEEGVDQLNKFVEDAQKGIGINRDAYFSSGIGVVNGYFRADQAKAMRDMEALMTKEDFGGLAEDDAAAINKFNGLSKTLGLGEADVRSAIDDYLTEAGVDTERDGEEGERSMLLNAIEENLSSGSYNAIDAITEAMTGQGYSDEEVAKVRNRGGAGQYVLQNMLRQVQKKGYRGEGIEGGFGAMAQASSLDMSAIIMASAATGMDMRELIMNMYAPDLVSRTDASYADSQNNRIPNAINTGSGSFAGAAIKNTRARLEDLAGALHGEDGALKVDRKVVDTAFSEDADPKAKATAMKTLKKTLGKGEEGDRRLAMLRTIHDNGFKLGDETAMDLVFNNDVAKIKSSGTDAEMLGITRGAARTGSEMYGFMDKIGEIARTIGQFMVNPADFFKDKSPIPVTVQSGSIDVNNMSVFGVPQS